MSGLTRTQLESWRPEELATVAKTWRSVGSQTEGLFNRYVSSVEKVNGEYWSGDAAEAAHTRALADRKTATAMVDKLESLAAEAEAASHELSSIVRTARDQIAGAEASMFRVSDNFTVTDSLAGPDPERDKVRATWQASITEAALAAFNTDLAAQQKLAGHRADLIATFTDSSSLGGESGSNDGKALSEHPGELTDSQERRLIEAGRLTPEQLAALHDGNDSTLASISASQMEYINAVNRSLDGKSPQEIRDIVNKLPPDARAAFANMQQIGSNTGVTATVVGDKDVPTRGGMDVLPSSVRSSLNRGDRDLALRNPTADVKTGARGDLTTGTKTYELHGVADNTAIAQIVQNGDDRYKSGSALDSGLMRAGEQYLHAQVQAEQADHGVLTVDGKTVDVSSRITEPIFSSVAADKLAVAESVTDKNTGMQFVNDVQTHLWSDNGKAASGLFQFSESDYSQESTGKIMEAVARASSGEGSWKLLSSIPGTGGQSIGEANPELLRVLSRSMSPYISDIAGSSSHLPGFDAGSWADPGGSDKYEGARRIFAMMGTDQSASDHFHGAAMKLENDLFNDFGAHPKDRFADSGLSEIGRLHGLIDGGLSDAYRDKFGKMDEAIVYANKSRIYDLASSALGLGTSHLPAGADEIAALQAAAGPSLKDAIIGPDPGKTSGHDFDPSGPMMHSNAWAALRASGPLPSWVYAEYPEAVDENGRILTMDQMKAVYGTDNDRDSALDALLRKFSGRDDIVTSSFKNPYDNVTQYGSDDDDDSSN